MRAGAVSILLGLLLATPGAAEDLSAPSPSSQPSASPISASIADIERVHLAFQTVDLLATRCTLETGDAPTYAAMAADWRKRNSRVLRLADGILAYLEGTIDEAALAPLAEAHAEDLFDSIMKPAEICASYLKQVQAGELDLRVVVPDLHSRILTSDGAIAAMNRPN